MLSGVPADSSALLLFLVVFRHITTTISANNPDFRVEKCRILRLIEIDSA
jgi:hypothetical protein